MPARAASFASRAPAQPRMEPRATSSQRQTSVSSRARRASSGRRRKARCIRLARARAAARVRVSAGRSQGSFGSCHPAFGSNRPAAAAPAIWPSATAASTPAAAPRRRRRRQDPVSCRASTATLPASAKRTAQQPRELGVGDQAPADRRGSARELPASPRAWRADASAPHSPRLGDPRRAVRRPREAAPVPDDLAVLAPERSRAVRSAEAACSRRPRARPSRATPRPGSGPAADDRGAPRERRPVSERLRSPRRRRRAASNPGTGGTARAIPGQAIRTADTQHFDACTTANWCAPLVRIRSRGVEDGDSRADLGPRLREPREPRARCGRRLAAGKVTENLSAGRGALVEQDRARARLRRAAGGRHPRGSSADHGHVARVRLDPLAERCEL